MHTIAEPLADLAVAIPSASRLFQELRLDYCCHGRRSLAEACAERGLDPAAVLARVVAAPPASPNALDLAHAPIGELIAYVIARFHDDHRREVPLLVAMAEKVERVHADKASCPRGLHHHLAGFRDAMVAHLDKEEQVLFPAIRAGWGGSCHGPIVRMESEHEEHGAALARTRALAHDLVPPADACTTWRALYLRLARLESDLMEHIHLENNVLFPRVLAA
jgi:regulator of cell morphogenesis and NO signaling